VLLGDAGAKFFQGTIPYFVNRPKNFACGIAGWVSRQNSLLPKNLLPNSVIDFIVVSFRRTVGLDFRPIQKVAAKKWFSNFFYRLASLAVSQRHHFAWSSRQVAIYYPPVHFLIIYSSIFGTYCQFILTNWHVTSYYDNYYCLLVTHESIRDWTKNTLG